MAVAPTKYIPSKFPALPEDCDRALLVVLMTLPNQKARYYVNDVMIGYEPWNRRHLRWVVDQIDKVDPASIERLDPHFTLQRARKVLDREAASPGTGVEPTVDGLPEQWRSRTPKRVKVPKKTPPKIKLSSPPLAKKVKVKSTPPGKRIKVKGRGHVLRGLSAVVRRHKP
jgi:hypothetical protein